MIKIEGIPNLYKEPRTGAVLLTDEIAYQEYLKIIESKIDSENKIKTLENTVSNLHDSITCLTNLVDKLINEKKY